MTAQTLSLSLINNSTTTFRAWGSAISAALATAGFVQTADTGQINWTTVTVPGGSNTMAGYEVWRFSDTLQATAPIFMKLQYGTGNGAAQPQMSCLLGTGSDGAGNLTGTAIANVQGLPMTLVQGMMPPFTTSGATSTAQTVYMNSDGATLVIAALSDRPATTNQLGFIFVLERMRAWDGSATSDGVVLMASWTGTGNGGGGENAFQIRFVSYLPGHPQTLVNTVGLGPIVAGNSVGLTYTTCILTGTTLNPVPVLTGMGNKTGGPSQFLLQIAPYDYPPNQSITMSHYGVSRTWRTSGKGNTFTGGGWGGGAGYSGLGGFLVRID